MVDNPERHIPLIARAGGDSVTFHVEVVEDPAATIAIAREHALGVGVAFSPQTAVERGAAAAEGADICLCMSINPGYSGQSFMPEALPRIRELRSLLPPQVHVQVDGGVDADNAAAIREAGASLLVAGSAIFGQEDLPRAYRRLVQALA
jgi:ribulose-phosphate 3-epimerase